MLQSYLKEHIKENLVKSDNFNDYCDLSMFEDEIEYQPFPIFRWVGGKSQLLPTILHYAPKSFNRYLEPFLGGGAVFFGLAPKVATVSDVNPVTIGLYRDVRDSYSELVELLDKLEALPDNEETFLDIRKIYNSLILQKDYSVETSALFLYLNAKCFNGLYRENSKGEFNVGYAKESRKLNVYNRDILKAVHEYFNNNDITFDCCDFTKSLKTVKSGDFVYLDPPYVPVSQTKNFTGYSSGKFDKDDQVRLYQEFRRLSEMGVKCMLSNSDCEIVRYLYSDYNIKTLNVNYYVQPNSEDIHRSEVLILNY